MKTCSKCGETKDIKEFVKDRATCKVCRKAYVDQWRSDNHDKVLDVNRKYKADNHDKVLAGKKVRYNKPEVKLEHALRSRYTSAVTRQNSLTQESQDVLGCSINDYRTYLESLFLPGMSWDNYGMGDINETWHIDHIIPISAFDLTNTHEIKKAFHYTNTRPLWAIDNLKKSNKF